MEVQFLDSQSKHWQSSIQSLADTTGVVIGELSEATIFPPEDDRDQPDKLSGMSL